MRIHCRWLFNSWMLRANKIFPIHTHVRREYLRALNDFFCSIFMLVVSVWLFFLFLLFSIKNLAGVCNFHDSIVRIRIDAKQCCYLLLRRALLSIYMCYGNWVTTISSSEILMLYQVKCRRFAVGPDEYRRVKTHAITK